MTVRPRDGSLEDLLVRVSAHRRGQRWHKLRIRIAAERPDQLLVRGHGQPLLHVNDQTPHGFGRHGPPQTHAYTQRAILRAPDWKHVQDR